LKFYGQFLAYPSHVPPHVGGWIEIVSFEIKRLRCFVPPHVGGWIEIPLELEPKECSCVPPHVGGWIEIDISPNVLPKSLRPASCRRVD